jgi:DNA replication protein DnaC
MADVERLRYVLPGITPDAAGELCPHCLDTGVVVEEVDGVRRARPCDCRAPAMRGRRLAAMGIPRRYAACTLENFDPRNRGFDVGRAHQLAKGFVAAYPAVNAGVLFMGPVGVGKTHLAVGVLQALAEQKGVAGRWCDFGEVLADIRRRYAHGAFNEYELLEPLITAEVLLVDDLGSMKIRDWTLDVLSYVLNQRYVKQRLLLATTNYADARAPAAGAAGPSEKPAYIDTSYLEDLSRAEETLAERIGDRLRSRLREMCTTVVVTGTDFRAETHDERMKTGF